MSETLKHDDESIKPELRGPNAEHLAEGFRPIMACVGTREEYGKEIAELTNLESVGHNVDFYSNPKELDKKNFKNAGSQTYVISSTDGEPKLTKRLYNCTSLTAVGRKIDSETELSFLTHQDPYEFHNVKKDSFVSHLKERLQELKSKCSEGSIDIVITGGWFNEKYPDQYQESLKILSSVVKEELGFEPQVICGPKNLAGDDVYFDTQKRRLYVVRPDDEILHNEVFKPSKIDEMKEKWRKEQKEREEQKQK